MKTVMKKMFSLLLVAVLLVSAVPVAFAEGDTIMCTVHNREATYDETFNQAPTCTETGKKGYRCKSDPDTPNDDHPVYGDVIPVIEHSWYEGQITTAATCSAEGVKTYTCSYNCGTRRTEAVAIDEDAHAYNDGEITTKPTCSTKGIKTFTCAHNSSHTYTTDVDIVADNHVFSDKEVCTLCGFCKNCEMTNAHKTNCIYYCNGTTSCPNDPTVANAHNEGCLKTKCNLNGCTKPYGHTETEDSECSVPCTKTAGCVLQQGHTGACNTPCDFEDCTKGYNHDGDHSNACAMCELPLIKSPEHEEGCAYYYVNAEPEAKPGDSDLEIWVNLHTANVETKTVRLMTYENLSSNTLIYDFVSDRRDEIRAKLSNLYGKDYDWSGHVYDHNNDGDPIETDDHLGEGTAVYINAYTYQDLVYVYVHNSRSYSNIRVILFEGKQIGDTISRSEVVDAVNDYYNLSSLKMYSEDDWKKVVAGDSVDSRKNLEVTEEPFHIDVLISGTSKSGTSYSADSSNPKTGDAIYAPMMVLGASAACLAVLFFLNKKRAC